MRKMRSSSLACLSGGTKNELPDKEAVMDFTNLVVWAMIGYSAAVGKPQHPHVFEAYGSREKCDAAGKAHVRVLEKQHLTASYEFRPGQLSID